jgi:adenylosuccinate synthase
LERSVEPKNVLFQQLYGKPPLRAEEILPQLRAEAARIEQFVCDTFTLLHDAVLADKTVLLEGQLGALRDPDHGIYPYPTSSSPLAGFASVGAGIAPYHIGNIVAVVKAYSSCVGAGPFVSEIFDTAAHELRRRGGDAGEYGATTGRPRRMGWFDAVATRYGCRVQGATVIALTLLDVLGYLKQLPICTAYAIDGVTTQNFPTTARLEKAQPVWEYLPGWHCDISHVRCYADLPSAAQAYVERIEELVGVPVRWISVGPQRAALFER